MERICVTQAVGTLLARKLLLECLGWVDGVDTESMDDDSGVDTESYGVIMINDEEA